MGSVLSRRSREARCQRQSNWLALCALATRMPFPGTPLRPPTSNNLLPAAALVGGQEPTLTDCRRQPVRFPASLAGNPTARDPCGASPGPEGIVRDLGHAFGGPWFGCRDEAVGHAACHERGRSRVLVPME